MLNRRKTISISEALKFSYPRLHQAKQWYVDFLSYDPLTEKLKRKKIMIPDSSSKSEKKKRAAEIIETMTSLLRSGWSPWVNAEESRGYTIFDDATKLYLRYISKISRAKTRHCYNSRLNILHEYMNKCVVKIKYVYQFDTVFVGDFLDWIYIDRECSARTRNNYREWCFSLAEFFIEKKYLKSNPVAPIKKLTTEPKKRQPLPPALLQRVNSYLAENNKKLLLAARLEYYTFIRPEELSNLIIGNINIKEQRIFIPASISKNKRDANVGLNDEIIKLMLDLGVFNYPGSYYLFGKNLSPAPMKFTSEQFRRAWNKMRAKLKLSDVYQFYSLKDSGIRDLANSAGIVVARDQARHTDIATTNKYLQGKDSPVHEETKHFTGNL